MTLLIDRGARLDEQDNRGRTALMIAAPARPYDRRRPSARARRRQDPARQDRQNGERSRLRCGAARRSSPPIEPQRPLVPPRICRPARYSAIALRASGEAAFMRSDMPGLLPRVWSRNASIVILQILALLTGEPRRRAVALELLEVAPVAADRGDRLQRLGGDLVGRGGLLQVRPLVLGEVGRKRLHVVLLERLGDRTHHLVLARASLEVAQLQIEIALVLAPDDGRRLLLRDAVLAVAAGADLRRLLDVSRGERGLAGPSEDAASRRRQSPHCARAPNCTLSLSSHEKGRGLIESPVLTVCVPRHPTESEDQSTVKAMMLLPRLKSICVFPPAPTTMYCLPSTA